MAYTANPFSFDMFGAQSTPDPYQFFSGPDPFYQQHTQDWLSNTREGSNNDFPNTDDTTQFSGTYQDTSNTFTDDQDGQAATLLQEMRTSYERPSNEDFNYNHNHIHQRHASGPQLQQSQQRMTTNQVQRHSLPAQPIYSEHFLDPPSYSHDTDARVGANLLGVISSNAYAAIPVEALPLYNGHHSTSNGSHGQTQAGVQDGPLYDTEATIYATFGKAAGLNTAGVNRQETTNPEATRQPAPPAPMQADLQTARNGSSDAVQSHDQSTSPPVPAPVTRRKPAGNKRSRRQASSPGESGAKRAKLSEHQKRANHTNSEQRRRDGMKTNLKELEEMVPALKSAGGIGPVSKATALRMTVVFLDSLVKGNIAAERIIHDRLANRGPS